MADINKLIPFIIYFETGISDSGAAGMESLYERARAKGLSYDPDDRGGLTMVGITLSTYQEFCRKKAKGNPKAENLRKLSFVEWREILKGMFWDRWQADRIISQPVAQMLVDWVWTSGKYGITLPQSLLGVECDGIVGEKTLAAVNSREPSTLFRQLREERIAYTERICRSRPANAKFRNGWIRRINSLPA